MTLRLCDLCFFKSANSDSLSRGFCSVLFAAVLRGLTLDDWKWNAEQFNKVGEEVKKAGLQLGYHNHNFEWKKFDNGAGGTVTGYDEFLRLGDLLA